ncbi:hypothetical protein FOI68_17120 [Brevibacillus sp. LEMMJ03]|uniref:hypothetical protein n=1 Tax=Brevibacillus sp. LEMMJ03 TaxID=2595056 RepID=UPI00117C5738|nr:hypothetical protein [Brevibacillus sp. LEMMJ03]TRY24373.1 hypothetical protein FOI68_17120 [Brevibacillus sp. LEMMJ03]
MNRVVLSWLLWHQAVEFLKHDIPLMESSDTRFPIVYGAYLRLLGKAALTKEQEATKGLRRAGITILGEKTDRGEYFVMWRQGGQTEMLRIHEQKLRAEVQKKIDKLMVKIAEERQ